MPGCLNPFIGYLRNLRELRLNNNNFTGLKH